ncbi:hypothetical protein [Streptomyces sp. NPDC088775]|uniref:hypothetical protein n=1 Tax=Streptomyces sp. NPDC088775 TaxID=3365896 RepID=UPI0037F1A220
MGEQRVVIRAMRTEEDIQKQIVQAWERLEEACEGEMPSTLRELHDVDRVAFSMLIEGMVLLDEPVDQETRDLAGVKSEDQVLS